MPAFAPSKARVHVTTPQSWGVAAGTDFWLVPSANGMLAAGAGHELSDYGWTTTALTLRNGSAADFMASADPGDMGAIMLADASDVLLSPAIFGDYQHQYMAGLLLGYTPTKLSLEAIAAFPAAAANETATGFGLVEDNGSPIVADDAMAMIVSNGANFVLRSGAASDAGAAVDTALHRFKMVITSGVSIEWFIDGTSQGTIAIQADEWPAAFGAGVQAAGVNDVALGMTRIFYE